MSEPYLDALARKGDVFAVLLELSRGQDQALEGDDPEALLALLGRKRALIQQIEVIDRDLAASRAGWESRRPMPDERAEALLRKIRSTLEDLMACEEETRRRAEAMKASTLGELSKLRQGRRAAELYRRSPAGGNALDREE